MSSIIDRLNASLRMDVINGDPMERSVFERQVKEAVTELSRLTRENEELLRRVEWQPIETAPKDGTQILLLCRSPKLRAFSGTRVMQGDWGGNTGYERWYTISHYAIEPTHWMPLPAVPEAKE